ncbi:hypothetical protein TNCV_2438461 [Trichonephila clavipes]|nr:hypothetical protein TNCV_2438461 [Trichonephila clavipes]
MGKVKNMFWGRNDEPTYLNDPLGFLKEFLILHLVCTKTKNLQQLKHLNEWRLLSSRNDRKTPKDLFADNKLAEIGLICRRFKIWFMGMLKSFERKRDSTYRAAAKQASEVLQQK